MFPYWLQHSLSYSGLIPCIIAIRRFRQLERRYLPLLLLIWIGMANDHLSYWMGRIFRTNAPNSNIWFLIEALLSLGIFFSWGLFRTRWLPRAIAGGYLAFWGVETLAIRGILGFSTSFHILYAFVTVLLAVQYINRLITTEQNLTLRNPDFLVCIGLILFNTFAILSEIFWVYGFTDYKAFAAQIYGLISFANFFTNLIFAAALICIPRKPVFLQLSSSPSS